MRIRTVVKWACRGLVLMAAILSLVRTARAQEVDLYAGFGVAHDGATKQQVNTFGDGVFYPTRNLGGLFADVGSNLMLTKKIGIGFDVDWRGGQATYTGIKYRPFFYNFDAIYQPVRATTKRFSTEFRAGIGGAILRFSPDDQQNCVNGPACQDVHHFQTHMAGAVRIYVTTHVFVRPAVDVHYVRNFSEFTSGWVPQFSVGVGYGLGRQ